MIMSLKWLSYLLVINIILGAPIDMLTNTYAQKPEELLDWGIEVSKNTFYPGEPILLTLKVRNATKQEVKVNFGADGIEAFTMEIRDHSNKVVAKGDKIRRSGVMRMGLVRILPSKVGRKSIVLNQWCSTLLPSGQYHGICGVEYRLRYESRSHKAGPIHITQLEFDITIVEMNRGEFKKILEQLSKQAFKIKAKSRKELEDKRITKEMLAFAESDLAVPYQLKLATTATTTWMKWDAINSLVRSGTLEAAEGLMQIISENEDCRECIEDIKRETIDAIYRLRETGKPDIINATDGFVRKYKRPVLAKTVD